jgi:AraC-like DNA-binding protein
MLARNAADLLTTLIAEHLGRDTADPDAAHHALLLRIRAFIVSHLGDPDLSPESIAAAHRISVRYLHRLFQSEGTTVSRWIQHRRLEECRRELSRPGRMSPAVAAVAHRWGFANPAHFSRVFRAAYGMSPREWQATTDHV